MKKSIAMVFVALLSIVALQAQSSEKQSIINVRAEAEREVVPDEIRLSIYVDKETLRNKIEIADAERQMLDILKKMRVDTDEHFRVIDKGSATKVGIIKRKNLQSARYSLVLSSANEVHTFIDAVAELNIRSINIISTEVSNREEILLQLRAEAVKKAKLIAKTMAEANDQSVGKAVKINDYTSNYSNYRPFRGYAAMSKNALMEEDSAPQHNNLQFESITLKAEVNIDFILD